jgi:hypothetical protein
MIYRIFFFNISLITVSLFGQTDTNNQNSYIVLNNGKEIHGQVQVRSDIFNTDILLNSKKYNLKQVRLVNDGYTKYANVYCGFRPSYHLANKIKTRDSIDFYKLLVVNSNNGLPIGWANRYYLSINDNKIKIANYPNLQNIMKNNDKCLKYLRSNQDMVTTSRLLIIGGYLTMGIGTYRLITHKSEPSSEPSLSPVILIGSVGVISGDICGLLAPKYLKKAIESF